MTNEALTFVDVTRLPKESLGPTYIQNVTVSPSKEIVVTYSSNAVKLLPDAAPIPAVNVVGATIENGTLEINLSDTSKIPLGNVTRKVSIIPAAPQGEGLLVNAEQGIFKKLVSGSEYLNVTETPEQVTLELDLTDAPPAAGTVPGKLTYDAFMLASKISTVSFGDNFIGPGTSTQVWKYCDVNTKEVDTINVNLLPDGTMELPPGQYYIDFTTASGAGGRVQCELFNATTGTTILYGNHGYSPNTRTVHSLYVRGTFALTALSAVGVRVKGDETISSFSATRKTGTEAFSSYHKSHVLALWRVSDAPMTLPQGLGRPSGFWENNFNTITGDPTYTQTEHTFPTPYMVDRMYINRQQAVKSRNFDNFLTSQKGTDIMFLREDGSGMLNLLSPVPIGNGVVRPYGNRSCLGPDGCIYLPAYNAHRHSRIVPMFEGGDPREVVRDSGVLRGYDFFAREIYKTTPHVTVVAPAPAAGYIKLDKMLINAKQVGPNSEYYSAVTATPEITVTFRNDVTLKSFLMSKGSIGAITQAELYVDVAGTRTLLTAFSDVGNGDMIAVLPDGAEVAASEFVIVILAASGTPGAIQFGTNGLRITVLESHDTSRPEGHIELVPGATISTESGKYMLAQGLYGRDEVMFIPVSNFMTRGGFEFFNTITQTWRKSTFGLNVAAGVLFTAVVCSPINNKVYIFTAGATHDNYVYDPVTAKIKALPYVEGSAVEFAINGPDGRIYAWGFGMGTFTTIVDPLTDGQWLEYTASNMIVINPISMEMLPNGKLFITLRNAQLITYDFKTKTATIISPGDWMYLSIRKRNGDILLIPSRRERGTSWSNISVGSYWTHTYNPSDIPHPDVLRGPYV